MAFSWLHRLFPTKKQKLKRDLFVGALRNREQLAVCLEKNFYHIPAARLTGGTKTLSYLAIYQSRRLFGEAAGIRYVGKIGKISLVKRKEITEFPQNSDELYYRFDMESFEELEKPLKPEGDGFICLRSSYRLLLGSDRTSALFLHSEQELAFFSQLSGAVDRLPEVTSFSYEKSSVRVSENDITVIRKEKPVFSLSTSLYRASPADITRRLLGEIARSDKH